MIAYLYRKPAVEKTAGFLLCFHLALQKGVNYLRINFLRHTNEGILQQIMRYRKITAADDEAIAKIVRDNLKAKHLDIPGTVYFDPDLDHLSTFYNSDTEKREKKKKENIRREREKRKHWKREKKKKENIGRERAADFLPFSRSFLLSILCSLFFSFSSLYLF